MNEPPSIPLPPMGVRYPLFADELGEVGTLPENEPEQLPVLALSEVAPAAPRRRSSRIAVAVALVLLAGMALLGWRLLGVHHASAGHSATGRTASEDTSAEPLVLSAAAPVTAPPGRDTAGHETTYAASNMVDDDPSTAWRRAGDGTGTTLTFTLAHPATVTSVGIVNGYAKTESGLDWYAGNRRVLEVSWRFDDGTQIKQTLRSTRGLQVLKVHGTHTGSVELTLLKVSQPGKGAASRDMTAISEVRITG